VGLLVVLLPFRFIDWGPFPRQEFRGWEATKEYWADIFDAVDDFRFIPERPISRGDCVVATIHNTWRGKSSGVAIDMRFAVVAQLRDDKLVRFEVFETRAEALEAVGLRE
jgi:ketosteroid isomerase-like protein